MSFQLFDSTQEVQVRLGNLPHWYQAGATYFVTFRTEDSVPLPLARQWYHRRDQWLRQRGVDPSLNTWKEGLHRLPDDIVREFHNTFSREFMQYLDRGYGDCVLRDRELADIVGDSLRYFDGERYHLGDFVVMPNHVHLLVCLLGSTEIEAQCYSWKKFTAGKINKALGRSGRFWQEESFDHLVRSPEQFTRLQQYIALNPSKAGLQEGEYLLYRRE